VNAREGMDRLQRCRGGKKGESDREKGHRKEGIKVDSKCALFDCLVQEWCGERNEPVQNAFGSESSAHVGI